MQFNHIWNKTKEQTTAAIRRADSLIARIEDWTDAPVKNKLQQEMAFNCKCNKKIPVDAVYCPYCGIQHRVVHN